MRRGWIAVLTIGALLTMGALRVADLRWSRQETIDAAEARAANLSLIVSAYLGEAFASGDAALRQLALHAHRVGGPSAGDSQWASILTAARAGVAGLGSISVVDRAGIIRHSTRPEIRGQSRRDEYVFTAAMSGSDGLIVGVPFLTIDKRQFIIPIARRLTAEDGSVEGAVVASFVPSAPRAFFRTLNIGERGTVWVFHPSGVVLFREPSASNPIGSSAAENPIFAAAKRSGAKGMLQGAVERGGPLMLSAFHTTATAPLIGAVSLDYDEVLASWWHEAIASAIAFGGVALTLSVTLVVLFRQMAGKSRAERALAGAQQLEAERLRDSNERLGAALEREQSARRDAEHASALKDHFLMTVSHELRTPLTAIYGWARMLVDGAVSERQKDSALRTIERNARAQARLVDDLLDVAGVMGGKLRLEVRPVSIASVVRNAVDTAGPAASARAIAIETTVDPDTGRVPCDPERLQQIIWNLLSNAVKFTPSGGTVRVTASRVNEHVTIAVHDTGVGIAPDFLPHVFERFRQEDAGTNRHYGGLGLGLAIVRSLVELHGGTVTADSRGPGQGSTFTVHLPAPLASPVEAGAELLCGAQPPVHRLDGCRVLIVDDDPEACTFFATVLEAAGASVTRAMSAAEALAHLDCAPVDVLVSDIAMPGVDGYALVRQALAIAERRGERLVPIAVTAYSRPEDELRSLQQGFHLHVRKPVDPAALVAAVAANRLAPSASGSAPPA